MLLVEVVALFLAMAKPAPPTLSRPSADGLHHVKLVQVEGRTRTEPILGSTATVAGAADAPTRVTAAFNVSRP